MVLEVKGFAGRAGGSLSAIGTWGAGHKSLSHTRMHDTAAVSALSLPWTGVTVGCSPVIGDRARGTTIPLEIVAELFWSPSDPNHRYGGCGRINSIRFFKGDPARDCSVNVEWIFYFESDHQERDRMRALEDEVRPRLAARELVDLEHPRSATG